MSPPPPNDSPFWPCDLDNTTSLPPFSFDAVLTNKHPGSEDEKHTNDTLLSLAPRCDGSSGKAWVRDVSDSLGPGIFIDAQEEFVERWVCESSRARRNDGEGENETRRCSCCGRVVCGNCRLHLDYTGILERVSALAGGVPMRMDSDILPGRGGRNAQSAARVYSRYRRVASGEDRGGRDGGEECCVHRSRIVGILAAATATNGDEEEGEEFTAPVCLCHYDCTSDKVVGEWTCVPCFKAVFADVLRERPCGDCERWFSPRILGRGKVEGFCTECGGVVVERREDEVVEGGGMCCSVRRWVREWKIMENDT